MGRVDAMAPVMAFTQSLELLSIEFHVYLVWLLSRLLRLSSLLYTALSEVSEKVC